MMNGEGNENDGKQIFLFYFSCGQETRVIPRILQLRSHWLKSEKESVRLEEAGITKEVFTCHNRQFV